MFKYIIFPIFLFSYTINFPYTFSLQKDEIAKFTIKYLGKVYELEFRWTLYKNNILTTLYRYDNYPRQVTLYDKPPLNVLRIDISKIPDNNPYFLIQFDSFDGNATFIMDVFNYKNVYVERE